MKVVHAMFDVKSDDKFSRYGYLQTELSFIYQLLKLQQLVRNKGLSEYRIDKGLFWEKVQQLVLVSEELIVTKDAFWFSGIIADTDTKLETVEANIATFAEAFSSGSDGGVLCLGADGQRQKLKDLFHNDIEVMWNIF